MELLRNGRRRVVVTGMGALTPLGTLNSFWHSLKAGRSGIRNIRSFDPVNLGVKLAAEVDFDPTQYIPYKEARRMSRASQMAQIAASMALDDAGLTVEAIAENADCTGVVMGTANAGFGVLVDTTLAYKNQGRTPAPTALVNGLPNMPGHYISRLVGATGPLMTVVTACASGTQSIGEAAEMIRNGRADMIFAGGVDCLVRDEVMAAFDAMTVLASSYNDDPEHACRPFDANREGFVLGEGTAVLVLETLERAIARDARIYGEVMGYAASSDAYHSSALEVEGKGPQKAMRWALEDAHVPADDIDYINAHGTATKANDAMETYAIKRVFGERAYSVPVSSTKSMIGHCMGGSGAMEAVACLMSLVENVMHPTVNYETPDPDCDLDYVPNEARDHPLRTVLSNSFGLGGQNACLVLGAV